MIPFLVCQFGKSALSNIIKECFHSDFPDIYHKKQIDYIYRYLNDIKAKSIVLEFNYIDKDYLDDFSKFYVRRFSGDGHKCARIHFFSEELNHSELNEIIDDSSLHDRLKNIQEAYLGFMVIKPLPKTFIGKTCLRRYDDAPGTISRKVLSRTYKVNLFGLDLQVNSIAFQEQDKIVSACATTAIWSSLHALNWRPIRDISSCSQITTNAINFIEGSSNSFPSKELSNKQILRALDVEGIKHHSDSLKTTLQESFFQIVQFYVDSEIPLILGATVYKIEDDGKSLSKLAGHAVTVLGYKVSSDREAIYLHDDRLGPFSRASFTKLDDYSLSNEITQKFGLILQEKNDQNEWQKPHEILIPEIIIAATEQKVRIPLSDVRNTCRRIQAAFSSVCNVLKEAEQLKEFLQNRDLTYKIRLAEIGEIKRDFRAYQPLKYHPDLEEKYSVNSVTISIDAQKKRFLTQSLARLQWVAEFYWGGAPAFAMLVDATDIPQGNAVSAILPRGIFETKLILLIMRKFEEVYQKNRGAVESSHYFLASFFKKLREQDLGLSDHLNKKYGDLRAPKYIKEEEVKNGFIQKNEHQKIYYDSVDGELSVDFQEISESTSSLIWVITHDGALQIGKETNKMGHPCLTGFKPARIAGEIHKIGGKFFINAKSGRYSSTYDNADLLLENALSKFKSIFWKSRDQIFILENQISG